ncbi:hypothetical protein [Pseudobutyrivibrio xylanivorans]|uniref:Uncharacterized protein n=1 Tax=Pseudobutyrivibrio xylanivorans DSM 14809 TaxID=1123012 RepID=A0A1M6CHA2_PSEXY|nr:hypothetical protein [Pseudobutyrivibrio xylanivorans]SHI60392.1 hypothetical protein SAMN02745725_00711 [Pseudobutyrivibrio xylanivorans DSM 14809]
MANVDFTEVTSDSFIEKSIDQQDRDSTINKDDLGLSEDTITEDSVHAYIVFTNEISINQGIAIIEEKVCKGQTLQVNRKDDTSNAIVAVVSNSEAKTIEQLSEVSLVKIDKGAQITNTEGKKDETEETTNLDETQENIEKEHTKDSSNTESQANESVEDDVITSETTAEVQENNLDTSIRPGVNLPIAIAVLLGIVVLIGIFINKSNR